MNTLKELKETVKGESIEFYAQLTNVEKKVARNGNPYWQLSLKDNTGVCGSTVFDNNPMFSEIKDLKLGSIVEAAGFSDFYQEAFAPKLSNIHVVSTSCSGYAEALDAVMESSPYPMAVLQKRLGAYLEKFSNRSLAFALGNSLRYIHTVWTAPASVDYRSYRRGLMEHLLVCCASVEPLIKLYNVDNDIVLAILMLHTQGQAECDPQGTGRSLELTAFGSGMKACCALSQVAVVGKLDSRMVDAISHGVLALGGVVKPATPEAILADRILKLHATMGTVVAAAKNNEGNELTALVPFLGTPLILSFPPVEKETPPPPPSE